MREAHRSLLLKVEVTSAKRPQRAVSTNLLRSLDQRERVTLFSVSSYKAIKVINSDLYETLPNSAIEDREEDSMHFIEIKEHLCHQGFSIMQDTSLKLQEGWSAPGMPYFMLNPSIYCNGLISEEKSYW